jgi:hypothetical protein
MRELSILQYNVHKSRGVMESLLYKEKGVAIIAIQEL